MDNGIGNGGNVVSAVHVLVVRGHHVAKKASKGITTLATVTLNLSSERRSIVIVRERRNIEEKKYFYFQKKSASNFL